MRILIIEDEPGISKPLKLGLERRNFAVDIEEDGINGLRTALINGYDCIILDLNLPRMDGLEVAKRLREKGRNTPILMLTARDMKKDVWSGFENGADDYLTKPFDFIELVYRINSLLKRHSQIITKELSIADILIDPASLRVTKSGKEIALNRKEYGILEYLVRKKGTAVPSEELLEHVWDSNIDSFTQTVRTNIKTLRRKVDPEKSIIKTLKGYGYIIN